MLPGHLVAEYWADVSRQLQTRYGLTPERAQQGITDYLQWMDQHRVGEIIYHRDAEFTAETIAGAVRQCLAQSRQASAAS